jgi:hypothetical protein
VKYCQENASICSVKGLSLKLLTLTKFKYVV